MRIEKKVAIASLLACSSATYAQTSVTVYGVVDAPVEYVTNLAKSAPTINAATGQITRQAGGNRIGIASNGGLAGSRLGFRGSEDLGSGMSAIFLLENGLSPDTGTFQQGGRFFGRQGYVGLQSKTLGRLTLGRQYNTMFDSFLHAAPIRFGAMYEPVFQLLGHDARSDNTIKYTGTFGKITTIAHYSFGVGVTMLGMSPLTNGGGGEVAGKPRDNSAFGAGVKYTSDGLILSASYNQWNAAVAPGKPSPAKKAGIAASYVIGPAKIMGGYRWGNGESDTGVTLLRDDFYWAGIQYRAAPNLELTLGYYYDDVKRQRLNAATPLMNVSNPWQVSFQMAYSLSKRTDVYLTSAYSKNSGLNMDNTANSFAGGFYLAQGKTHQLGTAVGIRHRF